MRTWLVILSLVCGAVICNAQTKVQFINCIADPAYPVLDVWVIQSTTQDTTITKVADDLGFTKCTPYVEIPSSINTKVCAAPPNSTSITDTIGAFIIPYSSLRKGQILCVTLKGVLSQGFAVNPAGKSIKYGGILTFLNKRQSTATNDIEFIAVSAVTDSKFIFPKISDWNHYFDPVEFSTESSRLKRLADYRDTITIFYDTLCQTMGSFTFNFSSYSGKLGMLCVAGFVDPSKNKNGSGLQIFMAWEDGTTTSMQRLQDTLVRAPLTFMNGIASPDVPTIDIYFNGKKVADNVEFRTSVVDSIWVHEGTSKVTITKGESSGITDNVLVSKDFPISICSTSTFVIHGLSGDGYKTVNGRNNSVNIVMLNTIIGGNFVTSNNTQVLHISTDAPVCDININDKGMTHQFKDVDYSQYRVPIRPFYPNPTTISIKYKDDIDSTVRKFDGSAHSGQKGVLIVSGFRTPSENKNGKPLEMHYARIGISSAWENLAGLSDVDDKVSNTKMLLYPNPSDYNVQVHFTTESTNVVTIEVNDMVGNVVGTTNIGVIDPGEHVYTVSTSTLPTGVYTCVVKKDNQLITSRFMVVR